MVPLSYRGEYNPEKTNNGIHLKVEQTKQWRVVQGSEKQVGEEPSLLSVRTTAYSNAPHTLQVHVIPEAIQEHRKQSHNDRQAPHIQVPTLQLLKMSVGPVVCCCQSSNHRMDAS